MYDPFSRRLLEHLGHDNYVPANVATLMTDLGVSPEDAGAFKEAVDKLRGAGRLDVDDKGLVRLPAVGETVTGVFRKNMRGFGFVVPSTPVREGDIFIPADQTADALSGDTVEVKVGRRRVQGREEMFGKIIGVVGRKRKVFSGELEKRGTQWVVFPDGRELTDPIVVRDPHAKNARQGDKVVVELTVYPEGNTLAEGVIVDVLGEAGKPSVETMATVAAYNLPGEFPQEVVAQARRCSDQFERELEQYEHDEQARTMREDLRGGFIITIDPPDAKDYDDAIHIKRLPDGRGWELGVHIADVAHFIPPGTPLDEEARKRGNSVYLPRMVIPMLPEVLSNGICSLQEGVPRFCKSSFMQYDRNGALVKSGVASVLIKSAKRLTYLEAQALIDGDETEAKKHAKTEPNYTEELKRTLVEMDTLARAIRGRRRAQGMIHLDLPSVELVYDDDGRVVDAQEEDDSFTHTLIEMFMVEANEVLARLFDGLRVPLLRRVHPEPTPGESDDLRQVVKVAGYTIPKRPTRMELQRLLDATKGTPAAPAVHFAVLRSLTRAEYSPALVGHFALASEHYAHFTSPIRRYPDLLVHRALRAYLEKTGNGSRPPQNDSEKKKLGSTLRQSPMCPDEDTLATVGQACSYTERNAADAETHLRSFLVLQLLAQHEGEEFRGMVTGCTNAGVFIRLEKYLAEGLIKKEDLPTSKEERFGAWRMDVKSGMMVSQSGRTFAVGDQVTVQIAKVDLAKRQMELVIADASSRERGGKSRKVYPKPGAEAMATPNGPVPLLPQTPKGEIDWQALKHGRDGASRRSQKSKSRDRGKKNHRRDG